MESEIEARLFDALRSEIGYVVSVEVRPTRTANTWARRAWLSDRCIASTHASRYVSLNDLVSHWFEDAVMFKSRASLDRVTYFLKAYSDFDFHGMSIKVLPVYSDPSQEGISALSITGSKRHLDIGVRLLLNMHDLGQ